MISESDIEIKKMPLRKRLGRKIIMMLGGEDPIITASKGVINSAIHVGHTGMDDTYLFDFKLEPWGGIFGISDDSNEVQSVEAVPQKIAIKPIEVLKELETIPTPFSLIGLEEKIFILKDKQKLIVQSHAKREVGALIERLNNRKKYVEHKEFFDRFQNTTDEKIDVLLKKYDLVMKTSDIFVPEFPDQAIKVMTEYTDKLNLICGKKPIFYVIAEPDKFRKAYAKRDPILLVQSPFGFFWQILGAWDKEMLLLSEL